MSRRILPISAEGRFWISVDRSKDCWIWTGARDKDGYGRAFTGGSGNQIKAHRMSWELHFGKIPDGMQICHRCDNPPCVNPAHLFLGTCRDNILDKHAKGRNPDIRGIKNPMAKITTEGAIAIKKMLSIGDLSQSQIAKKFGVSQSTVWMIANGRTWSHIELKELK